jgi:hypothetical protein
MPLTTVKQKHFENYFSNKLINETGHYSPVFMSALIIDSPTFEIWKNFIEQPSKR